jgi:hypothetical protein
MPLGPDEIASAVVGLIAAVGSAYGVGRRQGSKTPSPASPGSGDTGETLEVIYRLERKVDLMSGQLSAVNHQLISHAAQLQNVEHDVSRLKTLPPAIAGLSVRVEGLELRMQSIRPE